jgi:hypothetical protein
MTAKINQTGSRSLEIGNLTNPHEGFVGSWVKSLNPTKGIAHLALSLESEFSHEGDNQITKGAQPTAPTLQAISFENEYTFVNRFRSKDEDFTWAFGFETVKRVMVVSVDATVAFPSVEFGDVFEIAEKECRFLRYEKFRLTDYSWAAVAVFAQDDSGDVVEAVPASTVLVNETQTGVNITSTKIWGTMYEHLFELPNDRSLRMLSEEEASAMAVGDANADYSEWQRSLMMRFAKKYDTYAIEGNHAVCESFSFDYSSGQPVGFESQYVGFKDRVVQLVDLASEHISFDLACEDLETKLNINFYQTMFEIKKSKNNGSVINYNGYDQTFEEGVTNASLGVTIPLQKVQDTISGLYINEPRIEGKYDFEGSATVTYNKGTKFRELLHSQDYAHSRISSYRGAEMQEILIKQFVLKKAGPDTSDVAAEPLEFGISGTCGIHPFSQWLAYSSTGGNPTSAEVYESAVVMRSRNRNKNLAMTQSSPYL